MLAMLFSFAHLKKNSSIIHNQAFHKMQTCMPFKITVDAEVL